MDRSAALRHSAFVGQDDPEDEISDRLRNTRPEPAADDLGDRACIARLKRLKGATDEVARGGYVVEGTIGEGAYGTLYLARHPRLDNQIALKRLKPEVARQLGSVDSSLREARLLVKLRHPNVVRVFDIVVDGSDTFIAMEYVEGETLQRWQQEPRAWQEVLSVYLQVGEGLAAAHAAGLLHLDLKPANVLVGRDGCVRVVDFGIARHVGGSTIDSDVNGETLVELLPARGTIPYSSPEQRAGHDIDARSDQFSFCVALYEALHGELPFTATELAELPYVGVGRPSPGARGRIPRRIDTILRRGLARDRAERWPDIAVLLVALRKGLDPPRVARFAGLVAIVAASASAIAFTAARPSCPNDSRIREAWNTQVADQLELAFSATSAPWATVAFDTTTRSFDAYATAWEEAHASACGARLDGARSDEHFDTAMACLDQSLLALDKVVKELMTVDADSLAHIEAVLSSLPSPADCPDAATTRKRPKWPDDAVRDVVFQAELALAMGRHRKALVLVDDLPKGVDNSAVVSAAVSGVRARAFDKLGDATKARLYYLEAIAAAEASDQDESVPSLWHDLVGLSARDLDRVDEARAWLVLYEGAVSREPSTSVDRAGYEVAAASVDMMDGDPESAERRLRLALTAYNAEGDAGSRAEISARVALGAALFAQAHAEEALELFEAAIAQRSSRLGPSHPDVANLHHNLATALASTGRHDLASSHFETAERLLTEAFGSDSLQLAPVFSGHSSSLLALGRSDEARHAAERARTLQERLPPNHSHRHSGLAALANVELEAKNFEAAHAIHLALLQLPSLPPQERAIIEHNIAWHLCEYDRCSGANEHLLAAMRDAPKDDMFGIYLTATMARVELARGNPDDAGALAREAQSKLDASGREDVPLEEELRETLRAASARSARTNDDHMDDR